MTHRWVENGCITSPRCVASLDKIRSVQASATECCLVIYYQGESSSECLIYDSDEDRDAAYNEVVRYLMGWRRFEGAN